MPSATENTQLVDTAKASVPVHINLGYRWYEIHASGFLNCFVLMSNPRIDGALQISYSNTPAPDHTPDIFIKLADELPNSKIQLRISADVKDQKFEVRKSEERTIHWVSNRKM